ncbi:hypothetical protein KP509_11G072500 [Ceratopteris richardii]|uniref:Polymerase nucleotidyl transferase domain-containing protein n=4 Tax=Ceratopteris richardii TaxID=49495 RepID=A0A8T2TR05_CERRI|nr:hypothetical protein KP509_11G072500 [Ceratopteris richardii]
MSLKDDSRSRILRPAVVKAVKREAMQSLHSSRNIGLAMGLREIFKRTSLGTRDICHSTGQISGKDNTFDSQIVGLCALQNLVSSKLQPALIDCSEGSHAIDLKVSLCSDLESADTLPNRIMRDVSLVLYEVMIKLMELELLKGEICTDKASQQSAKRENKKKKSKKSSGQSSRKVNTGCEEMLNTVIHSPKMFENEHEKPEKVKVEKCKTNKKKRHTREKSKESSGAPLTVASDEVNLSCGPTCTEELKAPCNQSSDVVNFSSSGVCAAVTLCIEESEAKQTAGIVTFSSSADHIMSKPSASESFTVDDHPALKYDAISQCMKSDECYLSNANIVEPYDRVQSAEKVDQASMSDEKIGVIPTEEMDKFHPLEGDMLREVISSAGECVQGEPKKIMDVDLQRPAKRWSASLDKVPSNFEVSDTQSLSPPKRFSHTFDKSKSFISSLPSQEKYLESVKCHTINPKNSAVRFSTAHEWPGTFQVHVPRGRSHVISPATERLHLDVGRNWQQRLPASFVALRNPLLKVQSGSISSHKWNNNIHCNLKSSECAPMYSSGYVSNRNFQYGLRDESAILQPAFPLPFPTHDLNVFARGQDEVRQDDRTPYDTDYEESNFFSGDFDEGYVISEEESERHLLDMETRGEGDYNQYFGAGVMFWNTADYAGTGYSRPPSLSSEDSSWARHEADLSLVLDDIMGFPTIPSSYTSVANPGIISTSPPAATYQSGYEHSMPVCGNEFSKFSLTQTPSKKPDDEKSPDDLQKSGGSVDSAAPDLVLRPIIVVRDKSIGRQVSGSESVRFHEARSPHVPRRRREPPSQRRPPSPVFRSVPPSPPPPPPSPVGEFGKRKGFNTARSGSSSPRRWGLVNAYQKEEQDVPFVLSEVLESAWGKRNMREKASIHPMSGALVRERLFTIPPLAVEKDHPDISLPMQSPINSDPSLLSPITTVHNILQKEIEGFCKQVVAENMLRKPFISAAIDKVTHAMQVLWPRSRLKVFGSTATGLALPCSDVDLVVCLPPVRNLEPIKEAGILEGRNGIKETCLQHAARYLADQDWVKSDTLKTIENATIPIIMLVAHVTPHSYNVANTIDNDLHTSDKRANMFQEGNGPWGSSVDREFVRLDISFEAPSHTGLRTAELFPAITPLALVLKQFLTDRSLDQPYTGGLSSYCLVIIITRFLQHKHRVGCPFQQNLGSLLMDFLYFFGCIFDPRNMGVCIRGGGMYVSRNRGHSIDPLHIEDPLYPTNNVGRNCFRILQCVKAFGDAFSCIEKALVEFHNTNGTVEPLNLLSNILPSVRNLNLLAELN